MSPNCQNHCGRRMTEEDKAFTKNYNENTPEAPLMVCYAYFCGEPEPELIINPVIITN